MPKRTSKTSAGKPSSGSGHRNRKGGKRRSDSPVTWEESHNREERGLSGEELEARLNELRGGETAPEPEEEDRLAAPIGYVRKHGGLPPTKKSLGQNWLNDPEAVTEMARSLHLGEGDLVVEIGPGGGALTEALLATGAEVLAVEIDLRMIEVLQEKWPDHPRLTLHHDNILDTDLHELTGGRPCVVVGNLPYNITSSLLFKLMETALDHPGLLRRILVLLQLEVAQRLVSPPGSSEYSVLSVFLRMWGEPELLFHVPKEHFTPPPKVDAGVIRMEVAKDPLYPLPHWPTFKRLVKGAFHKRRKMLRNSIPSIPNLAPMEEVDFDWSRRPQTLSAEEFAWLAEQLIPKRVRKDEETHG